MITEVKGNLLDTDCKYIAHGVNCKNTMGSGVARALYEKWPEVKRRYHEYPPHKVTLGRVQKAKVAEDKFVLNCFTQENFGYDGIKYVSYDAIHRCFSVIKYLYGDDIDCLAIPKIGCGLAGGDWDVVRPIIEGVVGDAFDVKVYYL